jgi:hypothetical protein
MFHLKGLFAKPRNLRRTSANCLIFFCPTIGAKLLPIPSIVAKDFVIAALSAGLLLAPAVYSQQDKTAASAEWDVLLAPARREGKVTVSLPASAELKKQLERHFDLHIGGSSSIISGMLDEGILDPIEPWLALPEVKEAKQWWGGHVWVDSAKRFVYMFQVI